jgi:FlaA1/EpsC-like NDP-sugar epimerase
VRKAPAATVADLARALIVKYGGGTDIPIRTVGIRPGEKVDEVLVNEYEIQRAQETDDYFTIYPEYRVPSIASRYAVGSEYTSANTHRLVDPPEIGALLDRVGLVEYYI